MKIKLRGPAGAEHLFRTGFVLRRSGPPAASLREVIAYEPDRRGDDNRGQVKRIKSKVANDLHRKVSMSRMRLPAAPWASPGEQ